MDAMLDYLFDLGEAHRILFASLFFILGVCVGSFANVCIFRLGEQISLVKPRSFCPACRTPIHAYDNIPLVSYILLKAKCRACGAKIPQRYFWVELVSGLIFSFLFIYAGLTIELIWGFYFITSLLIVTLIDFKKMEIPDEITVSGIFAGWLFAFVFPEIFNEVANKSGLGESVLGMMTGGGLMWVTAWLGDKIFKRESMGGGDIKLMAMAGAFLGVQGAVMTYFLAPFFAMPFGLFQKWVKKSEILPYGPFIAMAAVFSLFFGDWLLGVIISGSSG
ncbi:MAG: prepilin peptidase [Candidatus Omnitrophica bacterium]|nr:prepilin peptidase [Candidatus Omnitrophota bacterium]